VNTRAVHGVFPSGFVIRAAITGTGFSFGAGEPGKPAPGFSIVSLALTLRLFLPGRNGSADDFAFPDISMVMMSLKFFKPRFPQPLQLIAVVGISDNRKLEPAVLQCREYFGYVRVWSDSGDLLFIIDGRAGAGTAC
jgi:hypothetical protein